MATGCCCLFWGRVVQKNLVFVVRLTDCCLFGGRVVQKNLVFVVGLTQRLADPEVRIIQVKPQLILDCLL